MFLYGCQLMIILYIESKVLKNMTPVYSNDLVLSAKLVFEQQEIVIMAFHLYQNLELRILIGLLKYLPQF